jgi:3-phosphoglycerate kinase
MEAELNALAKVLDAPQRPVAAIVGGVEVSTKLDLLGNLIELPPADTTLVARQHAELLASNTVVVLSNRNKTGALTLWQLATAIRPSQRRDLNVAESLSQRRRC